MTILHENDMTHVDSAGTAPVRRSPLHSTHQALQAQFEKHAGWQVPNVYKSSDEEVAVVRERVGVCDISAAGVLRVRGEQAHDVLAAIFGEAPAGIGDVVITEGDGNGGIARLARDEFLILTRPRTHAEIRAVEQAITRQVENGQFVSVIDQTSGLAGLLLAGPAGRTVLSKLCGLSFHPDAFPNRHAAQSSFAKVHATIIRHDVGAVPAFELYVDRSHTVYVWESVIDAGQEFGIAPIGWKAVEALSDESTYSNNQ